LVGLGERKRDHPGPSDDALDSVGEMLCRMLEERKPGTRWSYYRDQQLVPEGVTFFYAHEALRKMWGETPGNPDPQTPQAYLRMTAAERDERDAVLRAALAASTRRLSDLRPCTRRGTSSPRLGSSSTSISCSPASNLAVAQAQAGNSQWQDALDDPERDAEFEKWLAQQLPST
jgi:hypothetical protein